MTRPTVHDHGEPWDESDVKALQVYLQRGRTHQQIADVMGRTLGAVRSKIYRLRHL